jgi:ABC-type transporter Mla subunit MlaD
MGGRGTVRSLAASPTMVGAITTLIVIVAVFLAYNANNGLPFVPVYRVSAEMCDAGRMAPNNEVRIGGNRVGVIESIETIDLEQASGCQTSGGDSATAAAKLNLKLDDTAKPLPEDSVVRVRYRSSFGLKYLEIERGSGTGLPEGGTLPLTQTEEQTEFDDIGNTFDTPTRESSRIVLEGFGNAFAARGASLNLAIESLNPLFANLKPVSEALTDPVTQLENFFPELGDAGRIVAPVAVDNAEQFVHGAIAFGAISADEEALRDTISSGVSTLETGIRSLPVQAPFLRDFADFSRLLRPGVRDLRASLPILNDVVAKGAKVLPRTVQMNTDLQTVFVELEELVDAGRTSLPNAGAPVGTATLASLQRLGTTFDEVNSAGSKIIPAQTVCNYWNYWFQYLPEHFSGQSSFGLAERLIGPGTNGLSTPDAFPRNHVVSGAGSQADGRFSDFYDVPLSPEKDDPAGDFDPLHPNQNSASQPPGPGDPDDDIEQIILHGSAYGPTGTESAPNCQAGQYGLPMGEHLSPGQNRDSPNFGPYNVSEAVGVPPFGRTDLFLRQNGVREFWDSP